MQFQAPAVYALEVVVDMYPIIFSVAEAGGYDGDVSLGLDSIGDESNKETQVFEVIKDKKPCRLDFGHEVVGGLVLGQVGSITTIISKNCTIIILWLK